MYVYDEDFFSTRINLSEKLSPNNVKVGCSGIQVEVYFSKFKPLMYSFDHIVKSVIDELV